MELNEAIAQRRAVREYTGEAVDTQTIRELVAAAIQAPSAMNQQPWRFTVVRDRVLLDRLSAEAKQHLLKATSGDAHAQQLRPMLVDPHFQIFYHAPALILISAASAGPWNVADCALAAENLMLAACAAGLGSCWIGFAQGFLETPAGRALVDLPETWQPIAPIIVGHPKHAVAPVPRHEPEIRWIDAKA